MQSNMRRSREALNLIVIFLVSLCLALLFGRRFIFPQQFSALESEENFDSSTLTFLEENSSSSSANQEINSVNTTPVYYDPRLHTSSPVALSTTKKIYPVNPKGRGRERRSARKKATFRPRLYEPPDTVVFEKVELILNEYWIYKKRVNWTTGVQLCEKDSRALATFPEKSEAQRVIDLLHKISYFSLDYVWMRRSAELGLDRNYWIGLSDLGHEGQWEWQGMGSFLTYEDLWTPKQPDHVSPDGVPLSGRQQHCVGLWNPVFHRNTAEKPVKHTFDDKECHRKLYFICQTTRKGQGNSNQKEQAELGRKAEFEEPIPDAGFKESEEEDEAPLPPPEAPLVGGRYPAEVKSNEVPQEFVAPQDEPKEILGSV